MEGILRLSGITPKAIPVDYNPAQFTLKEPYIENSVTGWQLKTGTYQLTLAQRDRASVISINPDGSRLTRPGNARQPQTPKVLFMGDSYTFGEGLNDNETLPWQLQEILPDANVINQAVVTAA